MDIAQTRPRLRTDLQAQQIDGSQGRFAVDVTDPSSGQTFRFWDVEYHIATAMNGQRDLSALAAWASAELGLNPTTDELLDVINKLEELGYLDAELSIPDAPELGQFTAPATSTSAPLEADDLALGFAGASPTPEADDMPEAASLELGFAGNEGSALDDQATYVAPDLSLGRSGSQNVASGFPGVDEDDVPTAIKDPRRQSRPSDPSIPPRPPTGAEPTPSLTPTTAGADDEGPTQLPPPATDFDEDEMSVDLTDHMTLGPEAVKEAVRQSQMIQAVDPSELETQPPPPTPSITDTPEASDQALVPVERDDSLAPTELPPHSAQVSKPVNVDEDNRPVVTPTPEPPTSSSRTGLVVLLLVLVLVGAAAAIYFLNLFDVRTRLGLEDKAATATAPKTVTPKTEKPPVKIELPSATLAEKENDPVEVKASQKGTLVSVVESGTEVEEGAEIARFRGGESFEREITATTQRLEHYQGKLDKAQASGVENEIARAEKKVAEKKAIIEEAEKGLEAFIVRAPQAGTFATVLEANAKVEQDQVIGSFPMPPSLIATFEVPADKKVSQGEEVEVASKADEKKRAGCQVTEVAGQKVTVECPAEEGLKAGDEVVLP